jgi:cytochrome b561
VLIALLAGHIGAALWHQFIRHDRLLARMGLGAGL